MSGAISALPPPGYGVLGQVITDASNVHQSLDTLTAQASSGMVSNTYAGLGDGATVSLDLSPQIASLKSWQNNISAANTYMQVTQNAMGQIEQVASSFYGQMPNLNGLNASEVDSIASDAKQAMAQVTNLLNTQEDGVYVFGGQDTTNPPVPNPSQIASSNFYSQIATAVAGLSANGAAATTASILQVGMANDPATSPFSAYMSQPAANLQAPVVQTGDGVMQPIGLYASANTWVASTGTGTTSTGSYMRDLLTSLATLGSLSSTQVNDPGFGDLVANTRTCLNGCVTAMNGDIGVYGDTQSSLTTTQTNLGDTATTLTTQLSNAQNADMAATLSNLSQVQTQLQASYQLIAGMSTLSLAKFLPAA
jgi:flagellar hook-associated protein 3 FlgL